MIAVAHTKPTQLESGIQGMLAAYASTAQEAAGTLTLMRKIEATVDNVSQKARLLNAVSKMGFQLAEVLHGSGDADLGAGLGALVVELDKVRGVLPRFALTTELRRDSIGRDQRLREHECDQLSGAYDDLIRAIEAFDESVTSLESALSVKQSQGVRADERNLTLEELMIRDAGEKGGSVMGLFETLSSTPSFTSAGAKRLYGVR